MAPVPSDFNACLAWLWPVEGGYSVDPVPTNMGIEQDELNAWCALHGSPPISVKDITQPTAAAIYKASYWQPYSGLLPPGVNLVFFDTNVNQGDMIGVRFLQQALGIQADGHWGVITMAAVKNINKPGGNGGPPLHTSRDIIMEMTSMRVHRYKGTKDFAKYGDGWLKRADDCQTLALQMAGVITT